MWCLNVNSVSHRGGFATLGRCCVISQSCHAPMSSTRTSRLPANIRIERLSQLLLHNGGSEQASSEPHVFISCRRLSVLLLPRGTLPARDPYHERCFERISNSLPLTPCPQLPCRDQVLTRSCRSASRRSLAHVRTRPIGSTGARGTRDCSRHPSCARTLHRAPVGQGPSCPDWLAISFGFWSGRALATGTAWAGLCLIHHHHPSCARPSRNPPPASTRQKGGGNIFPARFAVYSGGPFLFVCVFRWFLCFCVPL